MPEQLRDRLRAVVARVQRHDGLIGLLAGGSFVTGGLDEFSDLDLVLVVDPPAWEAVRAERAALAADCGPLLAAFTGEHVGEPRLLICLYGPPPVHVDLKFVVPDALATRVEDPVVLWARDDRVARALAAGEARYPAPDLQWIEDRFWVWVHYVATKLGRGELFEALDFGAVVRKLVLGPLVLQRAGARPDGLRRVERAAPADTEPLRATVAAYDRRDIARGIAATIALYRDLRDRAAAPSLVRRRAAEDAALAYLEDVTRRTG
jgi:hypothetical protein